MKTAVEKAHDIVDDMVEAGLDCPAMMHRKIENIVYLALKEQDRDTRHACAEAIVECPIEGNGRFWKGKVHNACMSVKAC